MSLVYNTAYKVHVEHTDQAEVDAVNIEDGAMLHTTDALYMGHNNVNQIVYPQGGVKSLGWTRYDDSTYTSSNKLSLADGVETLLPNNGSTIVRSHSSINFYNTSTNRVLALNENDVYMCTVVFNYSAINANQTFLRLQLDATNGTPYRRVGKDISFPKGNDVEHQFHEVFQYYADDAFVSNGSQWKITADGGTAKIWDIIFFIQRTQNASLS